MIQLYTEIGERIKRQRMKVSLTQQQLADRLGVSQGTVAGWERGSSRPNVKVIRKLADALEVSMAYLADGGWDDVARSDHDAMPYNKLAEWQAEFIDDVDGEMRSLFELYNDLNGEGKRRVIEFMFDLRQIRRYQSTLYAARSEAEKGE